MSHNLPQRITSFQRDQLNFDVLDEGPLSATPIVLLHGFPEFNTTWNEVGTILREQGYRTIAPKQRGYSTGARPLARRDYRIAELAQDIVALVDVIGAPVHLVGHDWGAGVAWAVAATRPDILRSLTTVSVPHPGAFIRALPRGQILRSWYMFLINRREQPSLQLAIRQGGWQGPGKPGSVAASQIVANGGAANLQADGDLPGRQPHLELEA